jgi:hypothetical protein
MAAMLKVLSDNGIVHLQRSILFTIPAECALRFGKKIFLPKMKVLRRKKTPIAPDSIRVTQRRVKVDATVNKVGGADEFIVFVPHLLRVVGSVPQ